MALSVLAGPTVGDNVGDGVRVMEGVGRGTLTGGIQLSLRYLCRKISFQGNGSVFILTYYS